MQTEQLQTVICQSIDNFLGENKLIKEIQKVKFSFSLKFKLLIIRKQKNQNPYMILLLLNKVNQK